jgi:hypothetical protein
MQKRVFTVQDNRDFAFFSGDHNPLHINDIYARRLLFGGVVTHGIHQVLWALNCWLHEASVGPIELSNIRALFSRPLFSGQGVELQIHKLGENHVRFLIFCAGELATKVDVEYTVSRSLETPSVKMYAPPIESPNELSLQAIEGCKGELTLFLSREKLVELFPNLQNRMSWSHIAALLATTRLVGNECPGLNSIYTELNLQHSTVMLRNGLEYSVSNVDKRIGMVTLDVTTSDLKGKIKVFFRPPLCSQSSYAVIKKYVSKGEFSRQRALVIGGSRGLGEVVAKLLSAGGAEVRLTYATGETDALNIIQEINSDSQTSQAFKFNVLSVLAPEEISRNLADWTPTDLYYFATPHIRIGKQGNFSENLFHQFCSYYLQGFLNTISAFKHTGVNRIFNPSSVMVSEIPNNLVEYAAAKSASEIAALGYQKCYSRILFYQPRLPRMMTDQTVQLTPSTSLDPIPVMLAHLRYFNSIPNPENPHIDYK